METVKNLMTGIVLSTVLFTSCSKENHSVVPVTGNNAAMGQTTAKMAAETPAVRFSSGFATTNSILMFSNERTIYEGAGINRTELLMPIRNNYRELRRGEYENFKVVLRAIPSDGFPALYLRGEVQIEGERHPIEFVIERPVELTSYSSMQAVHDELNMTNLMNIDLARLTSFTTMDMWQAARQNVEPGHVIKISEGANPDIYHRMIDGFSSQMGIQVH